MPLALVPLTEIGDRGHAQHGARHLATGKDAAGETQPITPSIGTPMLAVSSRCACGSAGAPGGYGGPKRFDGREHERGGLNIDDAVSTVRCHRGALDWRR
jgi:hypothetical protein